MSTTVPTLHNSNTNNGSTNKDGKSELSQNSNSHPPNPNPNTSSTGTGPPAGSSSNDKVMIVTGDSQNMVVDLSAVPLDLRNAIISGTTMVTLPDGLNSRLEPGYTMITLPQDHEYEHIPPYPPKESIPKNPARDDVSKYGTKNMTHVWDVMQHSNLGKGNYKGKGKRITTVLPFHPNQDAHVSTSLIY